MSNAREKHALLPCPFCGRKPEIISRRGSTALRCENDQCIIWAGQPVPYNDHDHRGSAIAAWNTREPAEAKPKYVAAEPVGWSVLQIGNRGAAYDPANAKRAFTYDKQAGNVDAGKLGRAADVASNMSAGDSIDRGLALLKALQVEGFGVFQIGESTPQAGGYA